MNESQTNDSFDPLSEIRQVRAAGEIQEYEERAQRAETERARAERRALDAAMRWDRERERLQAQVAELTTDLGRVRNQGDENEDLKQRLEQADLDFRHLQVRSDKQAGELEGHNEALEKRNGELEEKIVELLSRAGNDHRRTQALEDRAAAELEVHKRKVEIEHEQALRASEVRWKKEVRTLEKEIERLRREVVRRPPSLFQRLRSSGS